MSLPYDAMSWFEVCGCGISWSYSLALFFNECHHHRSRGLKHILQAKVSAYIAQVFTLQFSNHFKKIIKRYKSVGYNIKMENERRLAYWAIQPGTVYSFDFPIYLYDVGIHQNE